MNELKVLLGETYTCQGGEVVTVGRVPFGKLNIFSAAITSLFSKIEALLDGLTKLDMKSGIALVMDAAFEETVAVMGLLLNRPREWFDTLDPGDGIEIAAKLYEKNFDDRLKKNLTGLLKATISQLQTRFKFSSPQDIAGAISSVTQPIRSTSLPEASSSSETGKEQT